MNDTKQEKIQRIVIDAAIFKQGNEYTIPDRSVPIFKGLLETLDKHGVQVQFYVPTIQHRATSPFQTWLDECLKTPEVAQAFQGSEGITPRKEKRRSWNVVITPLAPTSTDRQYFITLVPDAKANESMAGIAGGESDEEACGVLSDELMAATDHPTELTVDDHSGDEREGLLDDKGDGAEAVRPAAADDDDEITDESELTGNPNIDHLLAELRAIALRYKRIADTEEEAEVADADESTASPVPAGVIQTYIGEDSDRGHDLLRRPYFSYWIVGGAVTCALLGSVACVGFVAATVFMPALSLLLPIAITGTGTLLANMGIGFAAGLCAGAAGGAVLGGLLCTLYCLLIKPCLPEKTIKYQPNAAGVTEGEVAVKPNTASWSCLYDFNPFACCMGKSKRPVVEVDTSSGNEAAASTATGASSPAT